MIDEPTALAFTSYEVEENEGDITEENEIKPIKRLTYTKNA
jgi:hypothetical protein